MKSIWIALIVVAALAIPAARKALAHRRKGGHRA